MEQFEKIGAFSRKYLWQSIKALFCLIQFNLCVPAMQGGAADVLGLKGDIFRIWACLGWFAFTLLIAAVFTKFTDSIDDRCFLELCDEEHPVHFLRRPEWLVSVGVFALGVAWYPATFLSKLLFYAGLSNTWMSGMCFPVTLLTVIGIRLLQIHRLYSKWILQREIQKVTQDEFPSVMARIGQAIVMFVAMFLLSWYGMTLGILTVMVVVSLSSVLYFVFGAALGAIFAALLILWMVRRIRRLTERRKFLDRLEAMRGKGEISFETEGHPYLSIFSPRLHFGLKITDWARAKDTDAPKTYLVSVANLQKRRLTVNLRENHVGQIAHELRLRISPAAVIIPGLSVKNNLTQPIHTWYTNFPIEFPKGEGEQILLLDPAPYELYICEGHRRAEGDNGSRVYDYTVWTKNAFANFIERT